MKNVVILGGGYGGLKVLLGLIGQGIPDDVTVTLIDKNPYHSLKTEFYTIAAGTMAESDVRVNFPNEDRIQYKFGIVNEINVEHQKISFHHTNDIIVYDYLIVSLGCEDNYHNVSGAREFTESVQAFSKARKTSMAIGNLYAYGKVTIVGAGLSGIEVASEIRESRHDLNIRLLDRGSSVLSAFDPKIRAHVSDWFLKNDVEVLHHANVEYVEKDGVCNNGVCYMNDVTIWTAGVQPHYLARALPYKKDSQNKLIVNDFYQIPEQQNIYVVGDCASSEFSPSAQLAGAQGEQVAIILNAILRSQAPKIPKPIKLKGTLGSLGRSDGFGNMMAQPLTGFIPRLAKSGVLWASKRH